MPAFPGESEISHKINKDIGDGQISSLREKVKAKTLMVSSQLVIGLSVSIGAFLYRI